jgi:ABC-type Fe3+/spermidine/putrescine transport system ATPase subunit
MCFPSIRRLDRLWAEAARLYPGSGSDNGGHMAGNLFELEDVFVTRGDRTVFDGVSARLPAGASCIVGPSGSGKSTLLRMLNRLADPQRGTIRYRSRDVRDYDVLDLRRKVCLVPQVPALLDGSVSANVSFGARLAGLEADVTGALELAGLDASFADRHAERLSVGEQQRVMLARALVLAPDVLLLDEPTSALDQQARRAVETTLLDLRRRLDISYVVVTHDPAQAQRMADFTLPLEHAKHIGRSRALKQVTG